MLRASSYALILCGLLSPPSAAQELQIPEDWQWILDAPAALVSGQEVPDSAWRFVAMPPGWHVTTGPGVLLYHPGFEGRGRFSLEAEIFLFPGDSQDEYGLFLGGARMEEKDRRYLAFVIRRDGRAAIRERRDGADRLLVAWTRHEAIVAHAGNGTARNVFRVNADADRLIFLVNGAEVGSVPREDGAADGHFGFRVGADVNLHASRLDVIFHLAPPRR